MQLPRVRELEVPLHEETLKDLISVHLQAMCLVRSSEEVSNLTISVPNKDGVLTIRFNLEPDIQTIYHI